MAVFREKPYSGSNFHVDLGSGKLEGPEAGLLEVIFPEVQLQTAEYRNGNEPTNEPRKIQSIVRYGNLLLKRGVIGSLSWYQWWDAMRNGDQALRNIIVTLLPEDRSGPVLAWKFVRARPVRYHFSPLHALDSEPLTETLELAFERFEME